jgi:hypothetical protein
LLLAFHTCALGVNVFKYVILAHLHKSAKQAIEHKVKITEDRKETLLPKISREHKNAQTLLSHSDSNFLPNIKTSLSAPNYPPMSKKEEKKVKSM